MSDKLKPCPFCGGIGTLLVETDEIGYVFVTCAPSDNGCGATGPAEMTKEEAIEAWNRRAEPQRKKGKWVRRKDEDCWECSECHSVLENSDIGNHNFYYCYHCGANMMDICGYMDLE